MKTYHYPTAVLLMGALSAGAVAQQADSGQAGKSASQSTVIEEVTITARRVEENLQDAPVSITVKTEQELARAGITDIDDLANSTANMTFTAGESGRLAAPVIRGLGVIDTRGFDNSVGVFIDGIYVSGRASQNVSMLDLARVEVVKGPQSALYGRNTFAGAINYVTQKPTEEFEGKIETTIGTDELYRVSGSFSGALTESVLGRLSFSHENDDGTFENAGPLSKGDGVGGQEISAINALLLFNPQGPLSVEASVFYSDEFGDSRPNSRVDNNCGQLKQISPLGFNNLSKDVNSPAYYCGEVPPAKSDKIDVSPEAYAWEGNTLRSYIKAQFEDERGYLSELTLSYTKADNESLSDLDGSQAGESNYGYIATSVWEAAGSPAFMFQVPGFTPFEIADFNTYISNPGLDQEYYSLEYKFSSPRDRDFRWMAGAFYFNNKNTDETKFGIDASSAVDDLGIPTDQIQFLITDPDAIFPLAITNPFLPNYVFLNGAGAATLTSYDQEVEQKAIFVSTEYDFNDKLTATFELRYTKENTEVYNRLNGFGGGPWTPFSTDSDSSFIDPRLILRYTIDDDLMVYGSAARGSRSGGVNPLVTDEVYDSFEEETNWTYELGFKSTLLDNAMTLNGSVFLIDWEDAQFRQALPSEGDFLTATTNATGITSKGFEIEAAYRITPNLTVNAAYGYSDVSFDDGTYATGDSALCEFTREQPDLPGVPPLPIDCVALDLDNDGITETSAPDLGGLAIRRTAKNTANAGIQYVYPMSNGMDFLARVDASYRSKMYTDTVNLQWTPSRTMVNMKLGVESESYDIYFWVENLTEEDAIESTNTFNSDLNSYKWVTTAVNIPQRRYGATFAFRF